MERESDTAHLRPITEYVGVKQDISAAQTRASLVESMDKRSEPVDPFIAKDVSNPFISPTSTTSRSLTSRRREPRRPTSRSVRNRSALRTPFVCRRSTAQTPPQRSGDQSRFSGSDRPWRPFRARIEGSSDIWWGCESACYQEHA